MKISEVSGGASRPLADLLDLSELAEDEFWDLLPNEKIEDIVRRSVGARWIYEGNRERGGRRRMWESMRRSEKQRQARSGPVDF